MAKLNKFYNQEEVNEIASKSDNALLKLMCEFNTTKVRDPEGTHYATHYSKFFDSLTGSPIKILEIGVKEGESLKLWKKYFHPDSEVFGIEINPEPLKDFKEENISIFYGDKTDTKFLQSVVDEVGSVDIIIDDAGHQMHQQKASFEFLFPNLLSENGIYVIEDLATSYWPNGYDGAGLKTAGTAIEYVKEMVDTINYRFWKGGRDTYIGYPKWSDIESKVTYFEKHIVSLYVARSIAFIEKGANFSV